MEEVKQAIASAIRAQAADEIGWFHAWPDGRLQIELQDFDTGKFIAALEAAGYRIVPAPTDASVP